MDTSRFTLETNKKPQFQEFLAKLKSLGWDVTSQNNQGGALDWAFPDQGRHEEVRVLPLVDCPLPMPKGWVIAALSNRVEEDLVLSIPERYHQAGSMPPLTSDLLFYSGDGLHTAYMKSLCPRVTLASEGDGVVTVMEHKLEEEGYHYLPLYWMEFPPRAGSGVLAVVVPEVNKELRRKFHPLHQKEVSKLTNIERSLAMRFKEVGIADAGICLREITPGVLHLVMAWPDGHDDGGIKRVTLRVSSPLGLLEEAWAQTGLT